MEYLSMMRAMKKAVMDYFFRLLHPCMTLLIITVDGGGRPNVMACSWNMPVSEEPPLIALAIGRESYTNGLLKKHKAFTANIPSPDLLKAVWICGTRSGREEDKVKVAGLRLKSARKVDVPIIEDCIASLECRVERWIEAGEATVFISRVLEAYVEKDLFKRGLWIEDAKPLLHLGGRFFTTLGKMIKA